MGRRRHVVCDVSLVPRVRTASRDGSGLRRQGRPHSRLSATTSAGCDCGGAPPHGARAMTTLMDRARLWLANTPEAHGIPYDSMHEAKGADLVRDLLAALSPVPPHSDEIAQLRALRDAVLELARTWEHEAEEIDQDGDFCCAHTRRND